MKNSIIDAYVRLICEDVSIGRNVPDDADIFEELSGAIDTKECINFNYKKKDGTTYNMSVIPLEFTTMAGKPAVKCYKVTDNVPRQYGPADGRTLYLASIGNGNAEAAYLSKANPAQASAQAPAPQASSASSPMSTNFGRNIPDGADVKAELEKAIANKECVNFNYTKKDGTRYNMSVVPVELLTLYGKQALKCFKVEKEEDITTQNPANGRTLYLASIGNGANVPAPAQIVDDGIVESETLTPWMQKIKDAKGLNKLKEAHPKIVNEKGWMKFFVHGNEEFVYEFVKPIGYDESTGEILLEVHGIKSFEDCFLYKWGGDEPGMEVFTARGTKNYPDFHKVIGYAIGFWKNTKYLEMVQKNNPDVGYWVPKDGYVATDIDEDSERLQGNPRYDRYIR